MATKIVTAVAAILVLLFSSDRAALAGDGDVSVAFARYNPDSHVKIDDGIWGVLLSRHVRTGADGINRFDYAHVGLGERTMLEGYLAALQKVAPSNLNASEQHAYWINFYNALTVKVVLDHYPVHSIRDIGSGFLSFGPWDMKLVAVEGRQLSLNNIEHDILRANWHEPRVHYALNCASLGCPNLQSAPYSAANLDSELDGAARAFINHPRGVSIRDGRLIVSSIYKWYGADFGGSDASIIAHLRKYAVPGLASRLAGLSEIGSYQYDWQLNSPETKFAMP